MTGPGPGPGHGRGNGIDRVGAATCRVSLGSPAMETGSDPDSGSEEGRWALATAIARVVAMVMVMACPDGRATAPQWCRPAPSFFLCQSELRLLKTIEESSCLEQRGGCGVSGPKRRRLRLHDGKAQRLWSRSSEGDGKPQLKCCLTRLDSFLAGARPVRPTLTLPGCLPGAAVRRLNTLTRTPDHVFWGGHRGASHLVAGPSTSFIYLAM